MSLRKEITVDYLNDHAVDALPGNLNFENLTLEEGKLTSRMVVEKKHLAINGFLHAAAVIAIADTSCGNACLAHIPEGAKGFTTIELKCNFLGTVRDGAVTCTATARHLGRTTQVWDAEVQDERTGKTIAIFRCTQMVLW